jgi:hypothetical protein
MHRPRRNLGLRRLQGAAVGVGLDRQRRPASG